MTSFSSLCLFYITWPQSFLKYYVTQRQAHTNTHKYTSNMNVFSSTHSKLSCERKTLNPNLQQTVFWVCKFALRKLLVTQVTAELHVTINWQKRIQSSLTNIYNQFIVWVLLLCTLHVDVWEAGHWIIEAPTDKSEAILKLLWNNISVFIWIFFSIHFNLKALVLSYVQ